MNERLRTIRLYGSLGARFGRVHRFVVSNAAEAIRAMCVQFKGFEKELIDSRRNGVAYALFIGKRNISQSELSFPPGKDDIRIAPVLRGSKRGGLLQVVLGAALIAASFIPGLNAVAWSGASTFLGMTGASLALGGVVQLLSPQQSGLSAKDSPDNGASYNFNGPVNTQAQGNPVPTGHGRMIIGGPVISAGIYAEDQM
ncbi:tail assembly protein [Pandoraea pneumonica]|nr:tail assembly protein [Pandoraea pneumonica]